MRPGPKGLSPAAGVFLRLTKRFNFAPEMEQDFARAASADVLLLRPFGGIFHHLRAPCAGASMHDEKILNVLRRLSIGDGTSIRITYEGHP